MLFSAIRSWIVCAVVTVPFALSTSFANPDAAGFIQSLGNQTIGIIQNRMLSRQDRMQAFSIIFKRDLDLQSISQSALGQFWQTATEAQKTEFVSVFSDYLISIYANKFSGYSGVGFKIIGEARRGAAATNVASEIDPPEGQAPIDVNWIVTQEAGAFKITDVEADNLSMAKMHQDEYASVIRNNGNSVQVLIDMLKEKLKDD